MILISSGATIDSTNISKLDIAVACSPLTNVVFTVAPPVFGIIATLEPSLNPNALSIPDTVGAYEVNPKFGATNDTKLSGNNTSVVPVSFNFPFVL